MTVDADFMTDPVTGLPGRAAFIELVEAERASCRTLLLLGVDRFGALNDAFGPRAADEVLEAVAIRIRHAAGPDVALARWGGDEFAVLCSGADRSRAIALADTLLDALAPSFAVDERSMHLGASIGIALAETADESTDDLVRDAGVALGRAKAEGGARWRCFEPSMRQHVLQRATLENELRRGIERDELALFVQPVVTLDDRRIVGLEALVRWRHPERGLLQPADFLPLAEQSGLVVTLGRWVLTEACRTLARWSLDAKLADVALSVNLAGRQLADPRLPDEVALLVQRAGIAPDRLILELQETMLIEGSGETLQRLLDLGVRLTLDDFGAGWTSMTHLRNLPIEALKVDRTFVAGITAAERDRHVFATIVALGHGLGIDVIAAGVETAEQATCVRELGCRTAQGYWFLPPVPADGVESLLRSGTIAARPTAQPVAARDVAPPSASPSEATVTLSEAAAVLGVSASTLRRWADVGRIASDRTPGGHRRFARRDLKAYLARAGRARAPVVRDVGLPTGTVPALARELERHGAKLVDAAVRLLYEGPRVGWFACEEGELALQAWTEAVAAAARDGDLDVALTATERLLRLAELQGASLLERHTFLERHADVVVRALQRGGATHAETVQAGRVLRRLRRVALEERAQ